jgi:hypothetical protein
MFLPSMRYKESAYQQEVIPFLGLNRSDHFKSGELSACQNLSGDRFPYLSPRKGRKAQTYSSPTALFAWGGKQILVDGTSLLYDGQAVGTVQPGEKQFAVVNTKLCIWPDMAYLDLGSKEFGQLNVKVDAQGKSLFTNNAITLSGSFGNTTAEYLGYHQPGRPGGADYNLIKTYTSVSWSADGGWVLQGEEEVSVQYGAAGSPVPNGLKVGDLVMLRDTDIAGNYQLNTRTYSLRRQEDGTDKETYGSYANNHQEGYYAKILDTEFVIVSAFDGIVIFKQVVRFDVLSAAKANPSLSQTFAKGQSVTISGSVFPYRNKSKAVIQEIQGQTLTFSENLFAQDASGLPLPRKYVAITAWKRLGEGQAFRLWEQYTESGEPDPLTRYFFFNQVKELAPGSYVALIGEGYQSEIYVYDSQHPEKGLFQVEKTSYLESVVDLAQMVDYDGTEFGHISIQREMPNLDYICQSENRLWGVSNQDRTIYASALGDPKNFFAYQGLSTDSYAVAVGSDGDFSGIAAYGNGVLCWKEHMLHKVLGSFPAEYQVASHQYAGVRLGASKSIVNVNETLFYLGTDGVYAFTGGSPTLISRNFGQTTFSSGVAGTDGKRYFLSYQSPAGAWSLVVYDPERGIWLQEDTQHVVDFCPLKDQLLFLAGNTVYTMGQGEETVEWMAQFTPFYETVAGRKRYSRLFLRVELPKGSWIQAEMRCDGARWETCGTLVGALADTQILPLLPNRCDKFEIRLKGKGSCAVQSLLREFRVGGGA